MVHCYENNGFYIVLDVNSGAVHVVDKAVYEMIPLLEDAVKAKKTSEELYKIVAESDISLEEISEAEIKEAIEEIVALYESNMLYTDDIYETYIGDFKNRQTVVKALCLHIAHDCNLACKYCFAEEGEYHGRRA